MGVLLYSMTSDGNMKIYCIGMIHLYKRWVYFQPSPPKVSLSLSLSSSICHGLFLSADIQQAISSVCLEGPAFNKSLLFGRRYAFPLLLFPLLCSYFICVVSPAPHADWQELQPHSLWVTEPVQTRTVEVKEQILLQQSRTVEDELIGNTDGIRLD